ncbi:hypothetical protein FAF44_03290 [Nonomuraea sp. MG754425]|uniref:hypothetical protein n=1 Tax=Nonomuraea sp. MG754425 TaxID=2570319 RepID=UPI001F4004D1|nr:hypothetical protein [Nonomuraea sp. MG754425]MCF6467439.1 hypothetical protein [Nonomuraea sp. MG754425]
MSDIPKAIDQLDADAADPANSNDAIYIELVASAAALLKAINDTRPACPAGVVAEAERFATAGVVASATPLRLPPGFPAQGLQLYDSAEDDNLFALGHISADRMTAAVADWIRHIRFAPDAVVDDPLATLDGGAERVRGTIQHLYAIFDIKDVGVCAFSIRLVAPETEGACPITYWPGEFG